MKTRHRFRRLSSPLMELIFKNLSIVNAAIFKTNFFSATFVVVIR